MAFVKEAGVPEKLAALPGTTILPSGPSKELPLKRDQKLPFDPEDNESTNTIAGR